MRRAAYLVAVSHGVLAGVGAIVIRPGTAAGAELPARMKHVVEHRELWLAAWLVPPVAAAFLLWLMVELRRRLDDRRLDLAVAATAVGFAIEGFACCLAAGALPGLAGQPEAFLAVERVVQLGTATFGSLGFTLGQGVATHALAAAGAPRAVVGLGWTTTLAGAVFMGAGAAGAPGAVAVANAILFLALIGFSVALARAPL